MGVVFRQSIKTTAVTFSGAFLGAAITYIYPFTFSKGNLGFYTGFIALGAILQFLVVMGLGSVVQAWPQRYPENDPRRKLLFSICLLTPVVFTVVLSIPYLICKQQIISQYREVDHVIMDEYYVWMLPLILLWSLSSIMEQYLISQIRITVAAMVREVGMRVGNLLLILLVYLKIISFGYFLGASIALYGVSFVVLFIYSRKYTPFRLSLNWKAYTKAEYRELIHYSLYHQLAGISVYLTSSLDLLLLAPLERSGMSSLAVYRNAIFIVTLMVLPHRAMAASSVATLNDAYLKNDGPRLQSLFRRSGVNVFLVTCLLGVLIAVNVFEVVKLFPAGYEAIAPLTLILLLGRLVDMFTGLNQEILVISKYYKFYFWLSATLLAAMVISELALIPAYGMYGAAWASSLVLILFNIIKMWFLNRKLQLHPFNRDNLYTAISAALAAVAGILTPSVGDSSIQVLATITLKSIAVCTVYGSCIFYLKPSPDLQSFLLGLRKKG
jgi:O-antigen/teichoic acid export membrane protein